MNHVVMRKTSSLIVTLLGLMVCFTITPSRGVQLEREQNAASPTEPAESMKDRTVPLPSDTRHTLWIPRDYQHQGKAIDVLFDFHGDPARLCASTRLAGLNCVVISVKYAGLSSVYRVPFSEDRDLFATILAEALAACAPSLILPTTPAGTDSPSRLSAPASALSARS